jgi:hypothetical protein
MSFAPALHKAAGIIDPITKLVPATDIGYDLFKPKTPPPSPGVPNPNTAANAAQTTTDQMRARRGMLANIYAGASNTAPVSGKTALGT